MNVCSDNNHLELMKSRWNRNLFRSHIWNSQTKYSMYVIIFTSFCWCHFQYWILLIPCSCWTFFICAKYHSTTTAPFRVSRWYAPYLPNQLNCHVRIYRISSTWYMTSMHHALCTQTCIQHSNLNMNLWLFESNEPCDGQHLFYLFLHSLNILRINYCMSDKQSSHWQWRAKTIDSVIKK